MRAKIVALQKAQDYWACKEWVAYWGLKTCVSYASTRLRKIKTQRGTNRGRERPMCGLSIGECHTVFPPCSTTTTAPTLTHPAEVGQCTRQNIFDRQAASLLFRSSKVRIAADWVGLWGTLKTKCLSFSQVLMQPQSVDVCESCDLPWSLTVPTSLLEIGQCNLTCCLSASARLTAEHQVIWKNIKKYSLFQTRVNAGVDPWSGQVKVHRQRGLSIFVSVKNVVGPVPQAPDGTVGEELVVSEDQVSIS
jgi:hypothetical protein